MRLFGKWTSVVTRNSICHSTHQSRWGVLPSLPPSRLHQGPNASTSDQKLETLWCWPSCPKLGTHLFYILPSVKESRYPERRHTASDRWNRSKWESVTVPDSWRCVWQFGRWHTHCPHSPHSGLLLKNEDHVCTEPTQMPTVAQSSQAMYMHVTTSFSKQRDNRHRAVTHRALLSSRKGTNICMHTNLSANCLKKIRDLTFKFTNTRQSNSKKKRSANTQISQHHLLKKLSLFNIGFWQLCQRLGGCAV